MNGHERGSHFQKKPFYHPQCPRHQPLSLPIFYNRFKSPINNHYSAVVVFSSSFHLHLFQQPVPIRTPFGSLRSQIESRNVCRYFKQRGGNTGVGYIYGLCWLHLCRSKKGSPANKGPESAPTRGFHRRTPALERGPRSLCNARGCQCCHPSAAAVSTTAAGDRERPRKERGAPPPACQAPSLAGPALGQVAKESRNLMCGAPTLAMTQQHPYVAINSDLHRFSVIAMPIFPVFFHLRNLIQNSNT